MDKDRKDTLIQPSAAHYHLQGNARTITVHGPQMCNVNDAVGKSTSRVLEDGSLAVLIEGAPLRGTANESNVKYAFGLALKAFGREHTFEDGAQDGSGEDGFILLDGVRSVLQIVMVPSEQWFWHQASSGKLETVVSIDQGAGWIHAAIEKKARLYSTSTRASMILLIDVRHIGKLASSKALRIALGANHPPVVGYGFRQLWLVGPISETCVCLTDPCSVAWPLQTSPPAWSSSASSAGGGGVPRQENPYVELVSQDDPKARVAVAALELVDAWWRGWVRADRGA